MEDNKPEVPADNILAYIKAKIRYDAETGLIYGPSGKPYTNVTKQGYIQIDLTRLENGRFLKGHHVAWFLYYGVWPSQQLDHDDLDRINNRIKNLQESNARAQKVNSIPSLSRDLPPGVYFEDGIYIARATIDDKTTYLGRYKTVEEASNAYQARTTIRRHKARPGECTYCDAERLRHNSFHPPHDASPRCESGKYNHCSCDTCF